MTREDILRTLEAEPALDGVTLGRDLDRATGNYFGMGISGRYNLAEYLPFDSLGMILTAELVKRKLNLEDSTIIIADEHAKTNGFDVKTIDRIAKERRELLNKISENLSCKLNIVLGSETSLNEEYKTILNGISKGNSYEKAQFADMEFQRRKGKNVKIGWGHRSMSMDERYFDRLYKELFGDTTTFVYVETGRALDGSRLPPYLNSGNRPRLMLREDEDLDMRFGQMSHGVRGYYDRLLDLFGKVVDCNGVKGDTVSRLRNVYGTIFGGRYI